MNVVMDQNLGEGFVDDLRASFPDVTFHVATTPEERMQHISDADVILGSLTREAFLAARRLRWIHNVGTGIDGYGTIPELVNSDVILTNARGPHANPMADHVLAMMLSLAHRLPEHWEDQKAHRWDDKKYFRRFVEMSGRTLGILGLGDIGMAVARRGHGFGMEVYAADRHYIPRPSDVKEIWGIERLDDLLRISDWFVVTVPLTKETRGMIDHRRIGLLKQGAHVIVISRGNIVDEEALIEGLRSGRIAGAGLDVVAQEPLPSDSPLWDMDNVILSPHDSAVTPELWEGRREIFKENLRRFLANEPFLYVCDKQAGF